MGAPPTSIGGVGPCSVLTATRARAEPRINGGQRVALGRKRKRGNINNETRRLRVQPQAGDCSQPQGDAKAARTD
jgi:hypothetical protein